MKPLFSRVLSCYAADTAGVCSALFELGGMTVVHDASGCNSTYATHDEPRWFDAESMVYISALTEMDAVCGNDGKLIDDCVRSALELQPRFITLCNSPIPLMIGCDMNFIAQEIERRSSIPTFAVPTGGMKHYHAGAAQAWVMLAERFLPQEAPQKIRNSLNILGATPLDFSLNGNVEAVENFVRKNNFQLLSTWAMNSSWSDLMNSAQAAVNLVISNSGLPLAEYMQKVYNIPFVCGLPVGEQTAAGLADALRAAAASGVSDYFCSRRKFQASATDAQIIGEAVFASALAQAWEMELNIPVRVIDPLACNGKLLGGSDIQVESVAEIAAAVSGSRLIAADNMYIPVMPPDCRVLKIPHEAFSGRCYHRERKNFMDRKVDWELYICSR